MSLSTRLLLALVPAVAAVTLGYGYWATSNQRAAELEELRREAAALGAAVATAIERAALDREPDRIRGVLDAVTRKGPVLGAVVYDSGGRPMIRSGQVGPGEVLSTTRLRERTRSEPESSSERELGGQTVLSSIRTLDGSDGWATLELLTSEAGIRAAQTRTVRQFAVEAVLVVAVMTVLILWTVRRLIGRPMESFVEAVRKVGRGDLSHRIREEPEGSEVAMLAREFNGMARRLDQMRDSLLEETDERIELEKRVLEAERVASVGTMATGVAHQIASPLNVIAGRAHRLLDRGVEDPSTARNLTVIEEQSRRISKVVRTLLDFARRPEPELRPVNVSRLMRRVCAELKRDAREADIDLRCHVPENVWARADSELLQEVVDVLLRNAVDALQEAESERILAVRLRSGPNWVEVEVQDSGPGIPEGVEDRIFDPFVTTKPGGIGLGLTVARKVVEQLGGELRADSGAWEKEDPTDRGGEEEGRGATFRFRLPAAKPASGVRGGADERPEAVKP